VTESLSYYAKYTTNFTIDQLEERQISLEGGGIEWVGENLFDPCEHCNEDYANHKSDDGVQVYCPVAEFDELLAIRNLINAGYHEFVSDDGWLEFAQNEARRSGVDPYGWPGRHISWNAAIDELRQDWEEIDLDGISWWATT
jgi:hypothetical protein